MDKIHEVDIDSTGVFKYILIELKDKSDWTETIVRGYEWAEYHYQPLLIELFVYLIPHS